MRYMYSREKFLQVHTTSSTHIQSETVPLALHVNYFHMYLAVGQEAVEAVEALMLEHHTLADQWQSCKVHGVTSAARIVS